MSNKLLNEDYAYFSSERTLDQYRFQHNLAMDCSRMYQYLFQVLPGNVTLF